MWPNQANYGSFQTATLSLARPLVPGRLAEVHGYAYRARQVLHGGTPYGHIHDTSAIDPLKGGISSAG